MKINTIPKLLEVLNKTLPCKEYFKKAVASVEKIHIENKGKKFDKYC